jgi:serine/threonine-protein kinase
MRALHIGAQIASALAAAHAAGVIHRDLKPDNIMLTQRLGDPDFVVLLDFGLAKIFAAGGQSAVKTAAGVLLGTPQYMSPEACESRPNLDHRTDIYALGILLFQMTTGMLPFDGGTMGEVLVKQVTQLPPPPRGFNPNIPPAVEQIILRCLAKNPDVRFSTMSALRDALLDPETYLHASPPVLPARSIAPGESRVDAKMVMAYAQAQQAAKAGNLPLPAPPVTNIGFGGGPANASAKTMMADPGLAPPRVSGQAPAVGQAPDMVAPAMPKMHTMRIATPPGYVSRPPRRMWPIVLVIALLLGLGGGAFAVAWFKRNRASSASPAASASDAATSDTTTKVTVPIVKPATPPTPPQNTPTPPPQPQNTAVPPQPPPAGSGSAAPAGPAMAVVVIDSSPSGAEVFGPDKKSVGKTPVKLELPVSDMPLAYELRLAGYRTKIKQLIVTGNTMVQVPLDRAPPPPSPSQKKKHGGDSTDLERPD